MADIDVIIEIQVSVEQALKAVGQLQNELQDLLQQTASQDVVVQGINNLAQEIAKATKRSNEMLESFRKPPKIDPTPIQRLQSRVQKATARIQEMNTALQAVTGVAAIGSITAIGSAIAGLGLSAVQASSDFSKYEVAFGTMLKSTERGKELFQELADFAINTPFDVKGVVGTSQKLMAFGVQAEDLTATMEILGDATAAFGGNSELLDRMGYALGQMRVSGRLNAQDMNQLANAGIPAWEMLAEAAGKSVAEIRDMSEKGMIDGVAAADTIMAGMHDRYGGAMEAMNQTVGGLWSSIEESATVALATIGDYLIDTFDIKGLLNTVATALGNVIESLRKAKEAGKSFSEAIIDAVPKPVLVALGSLVSVIGAGLVGACAAGTIAMWALIAPVLPIVAAIAGIGIAITALYVYWDDLVNEVTWAWNSIGDIIEGACSAFVLAIMSAIGAIVAGFIGMATGVVAVVEGMITQACGYCPQFITDFKDMLTETFNAICDWVSDCLAEIAKVFAAQEAVKENAGGDASGGDDGEKKRTKTVEELIAGFKSLVPGSFSGGGGGGSYGGGGGGGSRGVDMNAKQQEADMKRVEQEVNRVTEALAKASGKAQELTLDFQQLTKDINFEGMSGSDAVFEEIKRETQSRIDGINQVLLREQQAVEEAAALKKSAEETGNAEAIARAEAQYNAIDALHKEHLEKRAALEDQVREQQAAKALQIDTQLRAAQAEAQAAMNAANMETFMEYLEGENVARLAALEEEQALRQQLYDWRMESEMSLQMFALEAAETLKNQLADGFAELVVAGGSFADKIKDITKNIVQMFIKYVAQKKIADLYDKISGKQKTSETIANNTAEAESAVPAAVNKSIAEKGPVAGPPAYKVALGIGVALGLAGLAFHAKGGRAKGWSVVGEEGPELVNFTHPGRVYTADETAAAMQGFNPDLLAMASGNAPNTAYISSGAGETVTVSAVQNIYGGINSGMDEEDAFSFFSDAIMQGVRAT